MKAIILAAGFGTRLGDFGIQTPKGLIANKNSVPLLAKLLEDLQKIPEFQNGQNTTLTTNARDYQRYVDWLEKNDFNISLLNNGVDRVEKSKGALYDLFFTIEQKNYWTESILVLPSDTYYEFSLREFVNFAKEKNGLVITVNDVNNKNLIQNRLGCAVLKNDRVIDFEEKPKTAKSSLAAVPFYYYPVNLLRELKRYITQTKFGDSPGSVIPWFLQENIPVYAYQTKGTYIDVGTLNEVEKLKQIS